MRHSNGGNRMAFETIYDRYFNKLVWFARGFVENEQLAEDIVQEVFVGIIEKPERFDTDRKFSTWVYVVTSNSCKQNLRNQKNRARILEENKEETITATSNQLSSVDLKLLREKISSVQALLSDREKQLFALRFEQELKIKDMAAILDMPEGTVKSGIYYLLKKLALHLKEFDYE